MSVIYSEKLDKYLDTDYECEEDYLEEPVEEIPMFKGTSDLLNKLSIYGN